MNVFDNNARILNPIRVIKRGLLVVTHVVLALFIILFVRLKYGRDWYISQSGRVLTHWWMRHLTRMLGIRIYQHGTLPEQHALYVGNHVSFLDILVVLSITPLNFLSKNSVRYWPIVGQITAMAGTIFIKRSRRNQIAQAIEAISHALNHGRSIMVFPEGTTTLGSKPKKFHSGLFQAAINSNTPVQAVAIRYIHGGKLDRVAAYIDNDNLLVTLYRIMRRPVTEVHLSFCTPILPAGHERTDLANKTRRQIIDAFAQQWMQVTERD